MLHCKDLRLREARYSGVSFGAPGNRFDHRVPKRSFGQRYDRVLSAQGVWSESHLVGNGYVSFEGSEFHLSDHCGVYAYVGVCAAYNSKAKQDVAAARLRRSQLVSLRDGSQQKELEEIYEFKVYDKVPIKECFDETGKPPLGVVWVVGTHGVSNFG